jgi:hypothetical protein
VTLMAEETDRDGELELVRAVKVWRYLSLAPAKGLGILGQPEPHYYFHRPLHVLLGAAFKAGLVLDGLEEPAFPATPELPSRPLGWQNFPEIPPALVGRLRPA